MRKLSSVQQLRSVAVYGGLDSGAQAQELNNGDLHMVAATPGRLLDLVSAKKLSLAKVWLR